VFILDAVSLLCQYHSQVIWLERLIPEMSYYVLSGTLNLHTHSLSLKKMFYCNLASTQALPYSTTILTALVTRVTLNLCKIRHADHYTV